MGLVKKLFGWLYPKPTLKEVILQLNTLSEMLDFHSSELEGRADENRYKAVQYSKKELKEQARFSIKMHLQYLAWSRELQTNRAHIEGLSIRLQQGQYLKQTVESLNNVQHNLNSLSKVLPNINGLAQQAEEITDAINQMQIAGRVTTSTMQPAVASSSVKETDIDEALTKLEEEVGINKFPDPLEERISNVKEKMKELNEKGSR
ncbi:MAG: Snf7 family protein [Candidatus Ranarchaeia archaeon]